MSASNDLLGLFGTPAKPAAAPPNPFDSDSKPALQGDAHFDSMWEGLGGSPAVSKAAPKLSTAKSFRSPKKTVAPPPGVAKGAEDTEWATFDAIPTKPTAGISGAVVKDWGMSNAAANLHDDSDEEDEDVGDTAAEFDLLGLNAASAVGGARSRRRSSVALAQTAPGARRSSTVTADSAATGIAAAAAAAAASSGEVSSRPSVHIEGEAPVNRRGSASAVGVTGVPAHSSSKKDDSFEGTVWCRTATALIIKRWKERFMILRNGEVRVWTDRPSMLRGEDPLETVLINSRQALTTMKVNQTGADGKRLFYRCVVELEEGTEYTTADGRESSGVPPGGGAGSAGGVGPAVIDEDDVPGSRRVFKFGCTSQSEFETLTRALRASIEAAHIAEREKAAHSMALAEATNAADLFRHAIASPKDRPKRRSSVVTAGPGGGTLNIPVRLLDGTLHHVLVARGASVKDVLVSLRRIIGLKADADFSLCMRSENPSTGHDTFACLPDVMSAEEAEALASVENRSLVYKRRIYLPPLSGPEAEKVEVARRKSIETEAAAGIAGGSGGGAYDPGLNFDLPDVDTEAQAATSITDGAHSLLYLEAVFHVTKGYYLLPLQDCLILAGLQLISQKGRVSEADRNALASNPNGAFQGHPNLDLHNVYKPLLASVLSAQAIAEHKATSGKPVEDLLVACRREHARLSTTLDAFAAQRVYIKRVKQLPEYGGATFFATYQRLFADVNGDPKGSRSAAPTPAWADSVVCEDIHAPSAPKPLPVIVVINAVGVHVRPLPPWHNPSLVLNYSAVTPVSAGGDKVAASLSHELSPSEEWSENGSPVPWYVHKVELIEVWGVKKSRPTFTYRVRENQLRIAELTSPSFKEMASTLHAQVFALLAQREGKAKRTARAEASDYGSLAAATKAANREAENRALETGLPSGWSTIQDPITGQVAFWNSLTKQTVFSRPTA